MERTSKHYDDKYIEWQNPIGVFGGWAAKNLFKKHIHPQDVVLDFGCGGGWVLKQQECKRRIGIEVNPTTIKIAEENGIEVYDVLNDLEDESVDVIISNSALEHTLNPLEELKELYKKLKTGGSIIFIVPCENISYKYKPNDINHHLYSWSPMAIGNLFTEAGFYVISSESYIHKWIPRYYRQLAKYGGRTIFDIACRIWGQIDRRIFNVKIVGVKE